MHRKPKGLLLLLLAPLVCGVGNAHAISLGVQDPAAMKGSEHDVSLAAGKAIGARFFRVLIHRDSSHEEALQQVQRVRKAGFEPLVTIGGSFLGGIPHVDLLRTLAPTATFFTVFNEPDWSKMPVAEYRTMYTGARNTIRHANPKARVLICDCVNRSASSYLRRIGRIANDGIAWHPYVPSWGSPRTAEPLLRSMQRTAKRIGAKRIWATEYAFKPHQPSSWWRSYLRVLERHGHTVAVAYHVRAHPHASWDTALLSHDGTPRRAFYSLRLYPAAWAKRSRAFSPASS